MGALTSAAVDEAGGRAHDRAVFRPALALMAMLAVGCTEPNPYLDALAVDSGESGSTAGASGGTAGGSGGESTTGTPPGSGTGGGGGSSGGSEDTGPPPSCAARGWQCVDEAPEGWQGPFAHWEGDNPQAGSFVCPGPFSTLSTEGFDRLVAPAAECTCGCGLLMGAMCSGGGIEDHNMSSCSGAATVAEPLIAGCNSAPHAGWAGDPGSITFNGPEVSGGECTPMAASTIIPSYFAGLHAACEAPTAAAADCASDQRCTPIPSDPYFTPMCIWADGELPCPPDSAYTERQVFHRSAQEGRGCSDCTCEPPTGPCTGATIELWTGYSCTGSSIETLEAGGCSDGGAGGLIRGINYAPGSLPSSQCEASSVTPTGQATPAEPVTFCCAG